MNRRDALACLLGGVGAGVGLTLTRCTDPPKTATVKPEGWSPPPKDGTEIYDIGAESVETVWIQATPNHFIP